MSSILTTIAFIKSVNGTNVLNGVATSRLDNDEFLGFTFRAFNANEDVMFQGIQRNSFMSFFGKYVLQDSQLYVSFFFFPCLLYAIDRQFRLFGPL